MEVLARISYRSAGWPELPLRLSAVTSSRCLAISRFDGDALVAKATTSIREAALPVTGAVSLPSSWAELAMFSCHRRAPDSGVSRAPDRRALAAKRAVCTPRWRPPNTDNIALRLDASMTLTGSLQQSFLLDSRSFAISGYDQSQTAGFSPAYNEPLGVFYLSTRPTIVETVYTTPQTDGNGQQGRSERWKPADNYREDVHGEQGDGRAHHLVRRRSILTRLRLRPTRRVTVVRTIATNLQLFSIEPQTRTAHEPLPWATNCAFPNGERGLTITCRHQAGRSSERFVA